MHHTDWGTSNPATAGPNIEVETAIAAEMAAVADRRYSEVAEAARGDARPTVSTLPIFDDLRASQARAEFIKVTKIFFGLDDECPSQSGNFSA
jgi:hypothetical protein